MSVGCWWIDLVWWYQIWQASDRSHARGRSTAIQSPEHPTPRYHQPFFWSNLARFSPRGSVFLHRSCWTKLDLRRIGEKYSHLAHNSAATSLWRGLYPDCSYLGLSTHVLCAQQTLTPLTGMPTVGCNYHTEPLHYTFGPKESILAM